MSRTFKSVDSLVWEVNRCLRKGRVRGKDGSIRDYIPVLDDPLKGESVQKTLDIFLEYPVDHSNCVDDDIPSCVHLYPKLRDLWHPDDIDWSVKDYIDVPSPPLDLSPGRVRTFSKDADPICIE
jgi:hypothetical protein